MLSQQIRAYALESGFDLAGVAPLAAWQDLEFAKSWAEKGYGGQMAYLRNPKRADPRLILPSAQSMVCVGLVYNTPLPYSTQCGTATPGCAVPNPAQPGVAVPPRGWISRYAWGRDYHKVVRNRLEQLRTAIEKLAPGVETRVYVDTGPIVERAFARLSGIGWVGKNTCLINQQKGSWFFLGVILTSLDLEPDASAFDRCGSCTRCLQACPTGALIKPYVMDASRCIAYLNIELKGLIPAEFRPAIGANVFGCDICQDVCPWNGGSSFVVPGSLGRSETRTSKLETRAPYKRAAKTDLPEFQPITVQRQQETSEPRKPNLAWGPEPFDGRRPKPRSFSLFHPRLEDLASLTEDDFRHVFQDSPIKRAKYRGWLRNLCVVMGNSGHARFIPWLERTLREQEDPIVREHAEWALKRLQKAVGRRQKAVADGCSA
jgi:epoxyqueuosine reductase